MRLTGILLAAGASRRFGGDKRRQLLASGDPLAVHCARTLRSVLDEVLVVLRERDDELACLMRAIGCDVTHNPDASEGMGASIRHGIDVAGDSDGWLIMPADLPRLRGASIQAVAQRLHSAAAVVPVCDRRRGHPVGFSSSFREGLLALQGDQGARGLLSERANEVVWLDVDDPGIFADIDFPDSIRTVM